MAAWPWSSARRRAVRPSLSSSSVLALARSRAFTHAPFPLSAAHCRAVRPEMCRLVRDRHVQRARDRQRRSLVGSVAATV